MHGFSNATEITENAEMLSLIFQGFFLSEDTMISHTYKNLRQHFQILPLKTFGIEGEASLLSHIPADRMILEIRLKINTTANRMSAANIKADSYSGMESISP